MLVLGKQDFFRLISEDSSLSQLLITRLCERLRKLTRNLFEVKVSKKTGETIQVKKPMGLLSGIWESNGPRIQPDKARLILLPLSEQLARFLPKDGMTIANLPFSIGRLPLSEEPRPQGSVDLQIQDSKPFRLSRMHFALYQHSEGLGVLDLGSTLGTEVNGEFLGSNASKDFAFLKLGQNRITAGGAGSPFTFEVMVSPV
jgi:hypothetical protein